VFLALPQEDAALSGLKKNNMKLRVARHTNDLEKLRFFLPSILEFELLGSFNNHDLYDGILIGNLT
jgi:hypothetical protein